MTENKIKYNKKITIQEDITVVYPNGVFCEIRKTNDKLSDFKFFSSDEKRLYPMTDEGKEFLRKNHWSEHYNAIKEFQKKLSVDEMLQFSDFDSLIYIGGGYDGKLKDYKGNPLTSVIKLDDTYFSIYESIETTHKECEEILKSLKGEYIIDSKIVYIPCYNQNERLDDHYTITMSVLFPQDIFENLYKENSDELKKNVFKFLKQNSPSNV
jgi:hypothetical protein